MPLRTTPQEAGARWVSGAAGATQKIKDGVARVTVSPGHKAAQAADKWLSQVQQARDKFARNSQAVDLSSWQAAATAGADAFASGVQRREQKFVDKITPVFSHLASGMARIDAMPTVTYEQRKQKAIALMDHMHNYKG